MTPHAQSVAEIIIAAASVLWVIAMLWIAMDKGY